jgi:GMP synthase (glutamine-hydrolysing)
MSLPFLILETGQPTASMRRHGSFAHWIRVAAGLAANDAICIDVERGDSLPSREGFAGVLVTGSAAMVTEQLPWSEAAATWLAKTAQAGLPMLGICYGHQLIAHALGGTVGYNPKGREMGTVALDILPEAHQDPLFSGLPEVISAQVTHLQSVLQPPPGARILAANAHDACHAFRHGDNVWGLQFHPEFSVLHMRGYIAARQDALRAEGRDVQQMLAEVKATSLARGVLRRFIGHARN